MILAALKTHYPVPFSNHEGRGFGRRVGDDVGSHCAQASGYSFLTSLIIWPIAALHFFSVL